MRKCAYILMCLMVLCSCSPSEIKIPDQAKEAADFSRQFISNIIAGDTINAISMIYPEIMDDSKRQFVTDLSRYISQDVVKNIRPVEYVHRFTLFKGQKLNTYRISYEYTFNKGNVLFLTDMRETDHGISIIGFDTRFLQAPLPELTRFSLSGKTALHYIFLACCIMIPLFILATFIFMVFSKITVKKKLIWGIVIILVSLPHFYLNWDTGETGFQLLNFRLLGAGYSRPNLYSTWFLKLNIPIGAIIYWIKRKSSEKQTVTKSRTP